MSKPEAAVAGKAGAPASAPTAKPTQAGKYKVLKTLYTGSVTQSKDGKRNVKIVGYMLKNLETGNTMGVTVEQAADKSLNGGGIVNAEASSRKVQLKDANNKPTGENKIKFYLIGMGDTDSLKSDEFLQAAIKDGKMIEPITPQLTEILRRARSGGGGGGVKKANQEQRRAELARVLKESNIIPADI